MGDGLVHWKLKNIAERNKEVNNRKTFHVCGLEDRPAKMSILPKQSTDSRQSLSKSQRHFLQK